MSTISVILFKSKVLKNGESPIMIRLIKDRKPKYLSVGHNCHPDLWDFNKQLPNKKHPQALELELLIDKKKGEAKELLLNLERTTQDFSVDQFKTKFERKTKKSTVMTYLDEVVNNMLQAQKVGNAETYKSLKYVLKKFRKGRDFQFIDIDQTFLKKLELELRSKGVKDTTLSVYFRTLRAFYRNAIDNDYVKVEHYPFKEFKISKFNIKTEKRAILKDEIKAIEAFDVSGNSSLQLAKDIFLFSYYCSGINMIDLCKLDTKNLSGDILKYERSKTGQKIVLKLLPVCLDLIQKYSSQRPGDYFFPVLSKKVHDNELKIKNRVKKVTKQINTGIKELANGLNIDSERLTMYSARHTFATVLKRSGVATNKISEMLGHDSLKTTEIYLDSFISEDLYEASTNL
jgi:site-specific recombinase XerD